MQSPHLVIAIPNTWLRETLHHLLSDLDIEIASVKTRDELLDAIQHSPAVAVVDVFSFQGHRETLLDTLRRIAPETAIIALLSTDSADYQAAVKRAGVSTVVLREDACDKIIPLIKQALDSLPHRALPRRGAFRSDSYREDT